MHVFTLMLEHKHYEKDNKEKDDLKQYVLVTVAAIKMVESQKELSEELVTKIMELYKKFGFENFRTSHSTYIEYTKDDITGKTTSKALVTTGLFRLFGIKEWLRQNYSTISSKEKFLELAAFYNLIHASLINKEDLDLDFILNQKEYYQGLKKLDSFQPTHHLYEKSNMNRFVGKSFAESINQGLKENGFKTRYDDVYANEKYKNPLRKIYAAYKLKDKDSEGKKLSDYEYVEIYVPEVHEGFYSLGTNKFVMRKSYEKGSVEQTTLDLISIIRPVLKSFKQFVSHFYISKANKEILSELLQSEINSLLFAKRELGFPQTYEFQPFVNIETDKTKFTDAQKYLEHHKFYFRECQKKIDGELLAENIGGKGYDAFHGFPLHKTKGDPSAVNSAANYALSFSNDEGIPYFAMVNQFYSFSYKAIRNVLGSYTFSKAYEIEGVKPSEEIFATTDKVKIPSYNTWLMLDEYMSKEGYITSEGTRVMNGNTELGKHLHNGIKLVTNDLNKGVCAITDDKLFFLHEGERIYLGAMGIADTTKRENFGHLIEGLLQGRVQLSKAIQKTARILKTKEIDIKELLPQQEVFLEEDGEIRSLGYRTVGLIKSYFVKDVESSYAYNQEVKRYTLGTEWNKRLWLMGNRDLYNSFFNNNEASIIRRMREVMDSKAKNKNLYGKNGALMKELHKTELPGFAATVIMSGLVKLNEVVVVCPEHEIEVLLKTICLQRKDLDFDELLRKYNNDEELIVEALCIRNPSIDDANSLFKFVRIVKGDEYTKHAFILMNPLAWALQGGDADGDQAILVFLKKFQIKDTEKLFSVNLFENKVELTYGHKISKSNEKNGYTVDRETLLTNKSRLTFIELLKEAANLKGVSPEDFEVTLNKLLNGTVLKPLSLEECVNSASTELLTTKISKVLVGVSKVTTMSALDYISAAMVELGVDDIRLKTKLRRMADAMNLVIVQPSIDIQKWGHNLTRVVMHNQIVFAMSKLISLTIQAVYFPKTHALKQVFQLSKRLSEDSEDLEIKLNTIEDLALDFYKNNFKNLFEKVSYFNKASNEFKIDYDGTHKGFNKGEYIVSPEVLIDNMIEVINPEGKYYKRIVELINEEFDGVDFNNSFLYGVKVSKKK